MKPVLLACAALLVAGCEVRSDQAREAAGGAGPAQAEAEKIVGEAHAAFVGGDAFKIMAHYAPGAVMFDPAHRDPTADRNIQTQWATEFVAMKPGDLVMNPAQVQRLDDDTMVASGIANFTGEIGGTRRLLHARYSQVFQKQADGHWLIVHEHMSMPPNVPGAG